MAPRLAMQIADRTVLAMTCRQCHALKPGTEFPRYFRNALDRMHYTSRRCRKCWWTRMEASIGR